MLKITPEFESAVDLIENGDVHIFLTGKAGTGKSTLLNYFRENTQKKIAVLAPTGVAAVNVRGQTVHSFFGFRPDITMKEAKRLAGRVLREEGGDLYQELEILIIDEVSMLRSDLLDCIDVFLKAVRKDRHRPFGGLRVVFIGDLYQLPPVVSKHDKEIFGDHYAGPYFFDAQIFPKIQLKIIELETVHRQNDPTFIGILNAVRNNTLSDEDIGILNTRCLMDDLPPEDLTVCLVGTNAQAGAINEQRLRLLHGRQYEFEGTIDGSFEEKNLPTETSLRLKVGAQVMLLNNDSFGRWVNGTMATVTHLKEAQGDDAPEITVQLEDGGEYDLSPVRWDLFRYKLDAKKKTVTTETVGTFTQFPLKLAWAVTIHKSQGKTFDRVVIDSGRGLFAPGQMYVALSRCRSLEGLMLTRPLQRHQVFVDRRIVSFMTRYRYDTAEEAFPADLKKRMINEAIAAHRSLEIVYLKPTDEKSRRVIKPLSVGQLEFGGKEFLGLRAYCDKRRQERTFRVDRILELRLV